MLGHGAVGQLPLGGSPRRSSSVRGGGGASQGHYRHHPLPPKRRAVPPVWDRPQKPQNVVIERRPLEFPPVGLFSAPVPTAPPPQLPIAPIDPIKMKDIADEHQDIADAMAALQAILPTLK